MDRETEIRELHREIERISARLAALEAQDRSALLAQQAVVAVPSKPETRVDATATAGRKPLPDPAPAVAGVSEDRAALAFFHGTTLSFGVDGYYGYNFNQPVGRVNLLRAYDVTSNSFNINQASFIVEHLPTAQERFGGRIDLQFGQATESTQGSPLNEQRPQVWRNLYQAYGSYIAPVGSGLQVDFGKFASSLGNEGNYTKDQVAYSRAYLFNYLPFYHMGLRANYNVTPRINAAYWLVNGINNTEDTNPFKSQAFLFTLKPADRLTWNVNYYFGEETRNNPSTLNPEVPALPIQPGLPTSNILPVPEGREHIFNTYATWQATHRFALTGEADFVVNRTVIRQQPGHVVIGEVLAKYDLAKRWDVGGRMEYLDDRNGLFSGTVQALKETTLVLNHTFAPGFLMKAEYRRDWSNQRFFLSDTAGAPKRAQTTATVGLVYWWGMKQGSW